MKYEEIINEIGNKRRFSNRPGVDVCKIALDILGHPEENFNIIHVAGTNGKGSVSVMLSEIMSGSGYKTGLFTSPHLMRFNERIRVNGEMISDAKVEEIGNRIIESAYYEMLTYFDVCVLMALVYFAEKKCEVVILECGLGGRYDGTNAVKGKKICAFSAIGYDHMQILGDTIEKIASEKAGILNVEAHAVIGVQDSTANEVLISACEKKGVPYKITKPEKIKIIELDIIKGTTFLYDNQTYHISMIGEHQVENAALVVEVVNLLNKLKFNITKEDIQKGLNRAVWPGRMQLISKKPFILIDGAHNISGAKALTRSLKRYLPKEKFTFIIGVMADKDYKGMIDQYSEIAEKFICVSIDNDRTLKKEMLKNYIESINKEATLISDIRECLEAENLDINRRYVLCGSLYFMGEIIKIL